MFSRTPSPDVSMAGSGFNYESQEIEYNWLELQREDVRALGWGILDQELEAMLFEEENSMDEEIFLGHELRNENADSGFMDEPEDSPADLVPEEAITEEYRRWISEMDLLFHSYNQINIEEEIDSWSMEISMSETEEDQEECDEK
jgi:hypothetical protein